MNLWWKKFGFGVTTSKVKRFWTMRLETKVLAHTSNFLDLEAGDPGVGSKWESRWQGCHLIAYTARIDVIACPAGSHFFYSHKRSDQENASPWTRPSDSLSRYLFFRVGSNWHPVRWTWNGHPCPFHPSKYSALDGFKRGWFKCTVCDRCRSCNFVQDDKT